MDWRRHRKIIGPSFSAQNNQVVWAETLRAARSFFDYVNLGLDSTGRCSIEKSEEHMATVTLMVNWKARRFLQVRS